MSSYASLDDTKQYLGVTGTQDDTLLTRLISAASGFIDNYTNRPNGLAVGTYTDVRNGNGKSQMTMFNVPLQTVTSVLVDGQTVPQLPAPAFGVVPLLPGYSFDENTLLLAGEWFRRGVQNVQVVYTAGYPTIPAEIEQACIDMVGLKYAQRKRIGKTTEALTGIGTVTYLVKDLPADMVQVLSSYKRVAYVTNY